ncbi:Endonuclease I [Tumidithrix helvetica PCC 7403]|uniref:endonuclease n=1 Tax=Tumidithrix helvetica TaxID=3457545 RepID=UPI003CA8256F
MKLILAFIISLLASLWTLSSPIYAQSSPATTLIGNKTKVTIASYNVENLDPRDSRFDQLSKDIVDDLKSPDILSLIEVQDNNGAVDDSIVAADLTFKTLIDAIKSAGGPEYKFSSIDPQDDNDGGEPGGNIRVGFLYNPKRITLANGNPGNAIKITSVLTSPSVTLSLNPGRIDPTNPAFVNSRKPLIAEFTFNGQQLFVIANHFASKRGGAAADTQRLKQAQIVNQFAAKILKADSKAKVVVLGDLNDFVESEPLKALKGNILTNLIEQIPPSDRFTFKFQGKKQVLDHILISPNLSTANPEIDIVHINIGFSDHASDHDPLVSRFTITAAPVPASTPIPVPTIQPSPSPISAIFPSLTREELLKKLALEFAPKKTLSYRAAREAIFSDIDNKSNTIEDVYSGYKIQLDEPIPPVDEAREEGINTEHTYPQSKGANGKAKSDIHHLFPTWDRANSLRDNDPFGDIPDDKTKRWLLKGSESSQIPTSSINEYSESDLNVFEPREDHKGNAARAVFYFYTLYKSQADSEDPNFFQKQQKTLCEWHQQDPVDTAELSRSHAIVEYQGNENPFVLDKTLASRTYCP